METKREFLTKEQAIELVGGVRKTIHCFLNPSGILLGADWSWKEFENALDEAETIEKAGESAIKMKHPLCLFVKGKFHFFEQINNKGGGNG